MYLLLNFFSHFIFGTSLVSIDNIFFISCNSMDNIMLHLPFNQITHYKSKIEHAIM